MVEHSGAFEVVAALGEDAHVCVGFEDFAYEDGVVACGELPVDFAFEVGDAFADGGGFDFFAGHSCEVGFFEFVKTSARQ